jgi:hypothetical protein
MEMILQEIERALQARLYYLAVVMAVTMPDICAALEAANGRTSGDKYKAWYNAHLAPLYPRLTDDDCYSLRCGVVHQGRFGHPGMQYDRIIFTLPDPRGNIFSGNVFGGGGNPPTLNLDAEAFCRDVIAAVRAWFAAKQADANVVANLPNLVQFRPNGMAPFIGGVPVIA